MSEDKLHLKHLGACRTAFRDAPEACGRILMVGEDNPVSAAPEHALFPYPPRCAGWNLQDKILGIPRMHYLAIWRTNLCTGSWSVKSARERAKVLLATARLHEGQDRVPWDVVVLLGAKVNDAVATALEWLAPLKPFERGFWTRGFREIPHRVTSAKESRV